MLAPETITVVVAGAVGLILPIIAMLALDRLWPPLLRREFTVELPIEAWRHLARVEQWPSWAKHIKRVELQPAGELGLGSTGCMLLTNGLKPACQVPGNCITGPGDELESGALTPNQSLQRTPPQSAPT
jgi:hypothetical protein